MQRTGFRPAFS